MRLDIYLTENGLTESRTRGKNLIELGQVTVNGIVTDKVSYEVKPTDCVEILSNYGASLGEIKLEGALKNFIVDVRGKKCLDIGASNGGFCDVLLNHGASNVIALDVGECALPDRLIADERIIVMDKTNAKFITKENLPYLPELVTIDVSFISITQILPAVFSCLDASGKVLGLIKPQFECGKKALSKKGIIIDKKQEKMAVEKVRAFALSIGFSVIGICAAPHPFANKNQEYFIFLSKDIA